LILVGAADQNRIACSCRGYPEKVAHRCKPRRSIKLRPLTPVCDAVSRLCRKLAAANRTEVLSKAIAMGLLNP
jgi:hypothetical protein